MVGWLWFLSGLWLGGMVGLLMAGLCRSAALADDASARAIEAHHEEALYGDHPGRPE